MRRLLLSGILTLAVCGLSNNQDAAPPATMPARVQSEVPITEVALFNSGVGFFKHAGTVDGNAFTDLHFKTDQVNDILKSLVLQDSTGGHIGTVVYPSPDPVERTLHSYQVDISSDPPLEGLLQQLRGARVQLYKGDEKISGQIIGLQQKERPLQEGDKVKVIHPWFINVLSDSAIHSIALDDLTKIELLEPELQKDFQAALTTLAKARDQDKKTVTVNFDGQGQRHVTFAYLTETPIWKTSYRLILPETDAAGKLKDPAAKPVLQGWALVGNQTDADWTGVKLILIGGHPISFIENLYESLYIPRPVFVQTFVGSLSPQTYEGGASARAENGRPPSFNLQSITQNGVTQNGNVAGGSGALAGGSGEFTAKSQSVPEIVHRGGAANGGMNGNATMGDKFNPAEGVTSIADTNKIGEKFQYSIDHISLKRGQSAMIPVVTDPVEAQIVSIFSPNVLPKNPLHGARVKNTTGKYLLQGPVSVVQGGEYAGDARIEDVPPGQTLLLSYGIDQDVLVETKGNMDTQLQNATIGKGELILTHKSQSTTDYAVNSTSETPRTLIIEHTRLNSEDKLIAPALAAETTEELYRLELAVPAHNSAALHVVVKGVSVQAIQLASLKIEDFDARLKDKNEALPQKIRDAMTDLMNRLLAIQQEQNEIEEKKNQRANIAADQARIRDNIKVADHNDKVYLRLETKLNDQETQLETLDREMVELQANIIKQQKDYNALLETLKVE